MISNRSTVIKATVSLAAAFMASNPSAFALPAKPGPVPVQQPDGTYIDVLLLGDERVSAITTLDGKHTMVRDARGHLCIAEPFDSVAFAGKMRNATSSLRNPSKLRTSISTNGFPAHGKQRALAVLVEYPKTDKHPEGRSFTMDNPRQHFDDMLNKSGYSTDGATGCVHDYFYDSSSGIFDITFDVYGPVVLEKDLSFYNTKTNGENLHAWYMVEEACRKLDDQIDFSEYDRDRDGVIDNVYLFYAGEGAATGGNYDECIWQHAADIEDISGQRFVFDGVRLNHYACSNEYRLTRNDDGALVRLSEGIGTVCHEFSHVLGLPDLYDTTSSGCNSPGVWSLMDMGCHLNESRTPCLGSVFERMSLGWLEPEVIGNEPKTHALKPIADNVAYRIDTPDDEDEYFLLENRQQTGWDSYLPGHGMLVWHITYQESYWSSNRVNTRSGITGADIVRADGYVSAGTYNGDPFPGSTGLKTLNDDGYPNMLTRHGMRVNKPISAITEAGGIITFDICKAITYLDKVTGLKAEDITPTGFTLSWDNVNPLAGYLVSVYSDGKDGKPEYAGMYHNLNMAATSAVITGLTPGTSYHVTVQATGGSVTGEVSDPLNVDTPEMSFVFTTPEIDGADEISTNSFTAKWHPLAEAVDYALSVYTKIPGDSKTTSTDFTGGLESLPAGWSTNTSFTMSMNGYYGAAAPALSLADDYGRLQSPVLPDALKGLMFWYRERSGSGDSYIEVSAIVDGQWTEIDRIALPTSVKTGTTYTLAADKIPAKAMGVRLVYHRVSKGSLAIDDVVVSYTGDIVKNHLAGWQEKHMGSAATEAKVDALASATDYYFSVRGINAAGELSQTSEEYKVSTADPTSIKGIDADANASVSVDADGTVRINGSTDGVAVYDLAGHRIANPLAAPGLYIVRKGSVATKIVY